MGKLRVVLSRRILWFRTRRLVTAAVAAVLLTSCADDESVVAPMPLASAASKGSVTECRVEGFKGIVMVPGYQNKLTWEGVTEGCSFQGFYLYGTNDRNDWGGPMSLASSSRSSLDPRTLSSTSSGIADTRYYRIQAIVSGSTSNPFSEVTVTQPSDDVNAPPEATGPGIFRADVAFREGDRIRYRIRRPPGTAGSVRYEAKLLGGSFKEELTSIPSGTSTYFRGDVLNGFITGSTLGSDNEHEISFYVVDDSKIEALRDTLVLEVYNSSKSYHYTDTLVVYEGICDRAPPIRDQILFWTGYRDFLRGFFAVDTNRCHEPGPETLASVKTIRISGGHAIAASASVSEELSDMMSIDDVEGFVDLTQGSSIPDLAASASSNSLDLTSAQFEGLTGLVDLWIYGYDLRGVDWSDDVFSGLESVEQIILRTVHLSDLPATMFRGINGNGRQNCPERTLYYDEDNGRRFCELVVVSIGLSRIEGSISPDVFQHTPSLRLFELSWTENVSSLPSNLLQHTPNLSNLRLGHLSGMAQLSADFLDNVSLKLFTYGTTHAQLPSGFLADQDELVRIDMPGYGGRGMSSLDIGLFPESLPDLTRLILRENRLTSLPSGLLARMPKLSELNLANNMFVTLPDGFFVGLESPISLLNLYGNPGPDGDTATFDFAFPIEIERVEGEDSDAGPAELQVYASLGTPTDLSFELYAFGGYFGSDATAAPVRATVELKAGKLRSEKVQLTLVDTIPYFNVVEPSDAPNYGAEVTAAPAGGSVGFNGFVIDASSADPVALFDAAAPDASMPIAKRALPKLRLMRGGSYYRSPPGNAFPDGPTRDGTVTLDFADYFAPRSAGGAISVTPDYNFEYLNSIEHIHIIDGSDTIPTTDVRFSPVACDDVIDPYTGTNPCFNETGVTYIVPVEVYDEETFVTLRTEMEVEVVEPEPGFQIEWIDKSDGLIDQKPVVKAAIEAAVARWESILGDVADSRIATRYASRLSCAGQRSDQMITGIDDLLVFVMATHDDGPRGTLAAAAQCILRDASDAPTNDRSKGFGQPLVGFFYLDLDDVDLLVERDALVDVITHEFGHILGLGLGEGPGSWYRQGTCSRDGNVCFHSGHGDPFFAGQNAKAAFRRANGETTGGSRIYSNSTVPIEPGRRVGSSGGHWREDVLVNELMTPVIDRAVVPRANDQGIMNPLSAITAAALRDMGLPLKSGYLDALDDYCIPTISLPADTRRYSGTLPCTTSAHAAGDAGEQERVALSADAKAELGGFDLRGDILNLPIYVIDENGELREIGRN